MAKTETKSKNRLVRDSDQGLSGSSMTLMETRDALLHFPEFSPNTLFEL
jgi:hypothetical protein